VVERSIADFFFRIIRCPEYCGATFFILEELFIALLHINFIVLAFLLKNLHSSLTGKVNKIHGISIIIIKESNYYPPSAFSSISNIPFSSTPYLLAFKVVLVLPSSSIQKYG
jgi:hypothetical protein